MRPDATRRRIALFGNFGVGNLGNEATLRAMIENLRVRLPNVNIRCICSGPETTAHEYGIFAAPISAPPPGRKPPHAAEAGTSATRAMRRRAERGSGRLRAALRTLAQPVLEAYRVSRGITALKGCDALVMTGTGMLGDAALQHEIFRWSVIAKLCRCKLLFVSIGGGPVRRPLNRWFVKMAVALADDRSYRDASSKEYLAAIGASVEDDAVCPDLAFSLPERVLRAGQPPHGKTAVIGVGVMNWYGSNPSGKDDAIYGVYLERMALFVIRLLERGYGVRILIGDSTYDAGVTRDLRKVLETRGISYEDGRVIDEPAATVDELLGQLASVDVVVSARFHNLLLAMMLGKPVCAISYHEKFQPLMDGMALGEFCQDIEHIDVDDLLGKVAELHENAAGITLRMAREMEAYRAALDEQYERILARLSDRAEEGHRAMRAAGAAVLPSRPR